MSTENKKPVKYGVRLKSKRGSEDNGWHCNTHGRRKCCYGNFKSNYHYPVVREKDKFDFNEDEYDEVLDRHTINSLKIRTNSIPEDPWDDATSFAEKSWKWQSKRRHQWK